MPGTVFSVIVPVALKRPLALRAGEGIIGLALYQFQMRVPPFHAAGVRAELPWLPFCDHLNGSTAAAAKSRGLIYRGGCLRLVPSAMGLYSICVDSGQRGNLFISKTAPLEITNDVDFFRGHVLHLKVHSREGK